MSKSSSVTREDLEVHLGLTSDPELDAVDTPEKARRWLQLCERKPVWAQRFQRAYIAAQLTLLANGDSLPLAA